MNSYKITAIILSRREFGEADAFITVFSKEQGKLSLLTKGIRRVNSKRAPHLDTFNESEIYIHETSTGNLIATQAKALRPFAKIRENIKKIGLAFYASELVSKLTREYQEHPEVYDRLVMFLANLNARPLPNDPYNQIIKNFQADILHYLGFGKESLVKEADLRYYIEEVLEGKLNSPDFLDKLSYPSSPAEPGKLESRS